VSQTYSQVVYRYNHDNGCSIVGGGFTENLSWLTDKFLFSDWCEKGTRYIDSDSTTGSVRTLINGMDGLVDTVVIGNKLYLMTFNRLYKLESTRTTTTTTTRTTTSTSTRTSTPTTTSTSTRTTTSTSTRTSTPTTTTTSTRTSTTTSTPTTTNTPTTTRTTTSTPTSTPRDLPLITGPENGTLYKGGDVIRYESSETVSWTVRFHHSTHFHPFITDQEGKVLTFVIPKTGEQSTNVWFNVIPMYKGSAMESKILVPNIKTIRVDCDDCKDLELIVYNQDTYKLPAQVQHIVGMEAKFETSRLVNALVKELETVFDDNPWSFMMPNRNLTMVLYTNKKCRVQT
jgi:hypothetical protein